MEWGLSPSLALLRYGWDHALVDSAGQKVALLEFDEEIPVRAAAGKTSCALVAGGGVLLLDGEGSPLSHQPALPPAFTPLDLCADGEGYLLFGQWGETLSEEGAADPLTGEAVAEAFYALLPLDGAGEAGEPLVSPGPVPLHGRKRDFTACMTRQGGYLLSLATHQGAYRSIRMADIVYVAQISLETGEIREARADYYHLEADALVTVGLIPPFAAEEKGNTSTFFTGTPHVALWLEGEPDAWPVEKLSYSFDTNGYYHPPVEIAYNREENRVRVVQPLRRTIVDMADGSAEQILDLPGSPRRSPNGLYSLGTAPIGSTGARPVAETYVVDNETGEGHILYQTQGFTRDEQAALTDAMAYHFLCNRAYDAATGELLDWWLHWPEEEWEGRLGPWAFAYVPALDSYVAAFQTYPHTWGSSSWRDEEKPYLFTLEFFDRSGQWYRSLETPFNCSTADGGAAGLVPAMLDFSVHGGTRLLFRNGVIHFADDIYRGVVDMDLRDGSCYLLEGGACAGDGDRVVTADFSQRDPEAGCETLATLRLYRDGVLLAQAEAEGKFSFRDSALEYDASAGTVTVRSEYGEYGYDTAALWGE